ncbi:MAG: hypothetical protein ISS10_04210 [Candidatus Marinimicrobia bacterium]|nr:hypothetical protein [Candidatus Neomarinimicrobiota bacterium]MBL7060186.1 hypothetical protein [Candidatus Neomarinimicrobiota bacterium]
MKRQLPRIFSLLIFAGIISAQTSHAGLTSWYTPDIVALAGGGGLGAASGEIDRTNPALLGDVNHRHVGASMLNYPASIRAEMISAVLPRSYGTWMMSLRRLDYGEFIGMDEEGNSTENYFAGDTWVTIGIGKKLQKNRSMFGLTTGLFISQLEEYQSMVFTVTPGMVILIKSLKMNLGLSVRNFGIIMTHYTDIKSPLPTEVVGSLSKTLEHLPFEFNIEAGMIVEDKTAWGTIGGVFQLPYHLQLRWGVSSDKVSQITHVNLIKDYLAGSGAGLFFSTRKFEVGVSGYVYGTGGWISGVGVKMLF